MKISNPSSFKDPSGLVFSDGKNIFRQVNTIYKNDYDHLMSSGLYNELVDKGLLVRHKEVPTRNDKGVYKLIQPEQIPFISYPYEWCFSQLQDAALVTLEILKRSLAHNMSLKDASGFNIQFLKGRPILIDTLSFEKYKEGKPWVAYKQFCEQFLAPLSLMAYQDVRLQSLFRGLFGMVPLDLAAKLLPHRAKLNLGIMMHVILHARSQKEITKISPAFTKNQSFSRSSFMGLIESLENTVRTLRIHKRQTVWTNYSHDNTDPSYVQSSFVEKQKIVGKFLDMVKPKNVWDLGANTGIFSRIAVNAGAFVVSTDSDNSVIEESYKEVKIKKETTILPLILDITNPTPPLGWAGKERESIFERPNPDCILALALIHHLAIGNNIPLSKLADLFSSLAEFLIVEFIPKDDEKVRILLASREDIFPNFTEDGFEQSFKQYYSISQKHKISGSKRTLYLLKRKKGK